MADIERLDRALAYIEAHPEQHDQGVWLKKVDCGTAACLAGWVVVQEYPQAGFVKTAYDYGDRFSMVGINPQDEPVYVHLTATELLDINGEQADELFNEFNTLQHLKRMRDLLAADPGVGWKALREVREGGADGDADDRD